MASGKESPYRECESWLTTLQDAGVQQSMGGGGGGGGERGEPNVLGPNGQKGRYLVSTIMRWLKC